MQPYERLEAEFAIWTGTPEGNMVCCASGTSALHLALEVVLADTPCKTKIIVPDFTMIACARAASLAGHTPVFVDCRPDLLINPDLVERAVNEEKCPAVTTIMPVHIYGRPCDMNAVHAIAKKYYLSVIEDMAEAHGLKPHPQTDAATWSFYRNKVVGGEEGGAVAFRNPHHAEKARSLRSLGFTAAHDFRHNPRGHNYRLANCLATLILDNLARYQDHYFARRTLEYEYNRLCPPSWRMPCRYVPWVYDLRVPGLDRTNLTRTVKALNARGIEARLPFYPMTRQREYWQGVIHPHAIKAANEVFYLPLMPTLPTTFSQGAFDVIRECLPDQWHAASLLPHDALSAE